MGKRANAEGSIYKRSDGRWVAALSLPDGRRKVYYGETREAAHQKLVVAQASLLGGSLVTSPRQTLAEYLRSWLVDSARPTLRPKSYDDYGRLIEKHISPALGRVELGKLTPAHLQRYYRTKLETLSPRSVQYQHAILHRALKQAERWGLIARNPAALVDPPRPRKPDIRTLTPDQTRRLIDVAAEHRLSALWTLAIFTGMRQGELLGLQWTSVDLDARRLTVERTIQRIRGATVVGEPKSAQSRRTIPLPVPTVEALARWRTHQKAELLRLGIAWPGQGYVFTSEAGTPLIARSLLGQFKRLLALAELPPVTFHSLRHGAASALVAANIPPKVVQELLGHSSISVTMDLYAHLMAGQREQAVDALARAFAVRA